MSWAGARTQASCKDAPSQKGCKGGQSAWAVACWRQGMGGAGQKMITVNSAILQAWLVLVGCTTKPTSPCPLPSPLQLPKHCGLFKPFSKFPLSILVMLGAPEWVGKHTKSHPDKVFLPGHC